MKGSTEYREAGTDNQHPSNAENEEKKLIISELEKIIASKPFHTSSRSKQFLSYVVRHSLDGQTEKLKERTIGVDIYERKPDYATGDDPVVRVSAGEVRRRLEQYYRAAPADVPIRIDIPLGSYIPQYHWSSAAEPQAERAPKAPRSDMSEPHAPRPRRRRSRLQIAVTTCLITVVALLVAFWALRYRHPQPQNALDSFWAPALSSQHPILICLAKPVVYRPSVSVYEKYSQTHPGTFATEEQRDNQELSLDPNERITWKDMEVFPGYGVGAGDVEAALSISDLFAAKGKPHQLRIGSDYSFEDLRTSPSVTIGAFNNRWTLEMTSNLHFTFVWGVGIREAGPSGRIWSPQIGPNNKFTIDYGLVSRLLDAKTGQFVVAVAGTGTAGTQTAGEFVSTPKFLEEGLKLAPKNWRTKNAQFVLQTNVIDSIPGPPHVVAAYFW